MQVLLGLVVFCLFSVTGQVCDSPFAKNHWSPDKTVRVGGLPNADEVEVIDIRHHLSENELVQLHTYCVDLTNDFRTGKKGFTGDIPSALEKYSITNPPKPALKESLDGRKCSNEMAYSAVGCQFDKAYGYSYCVHKHSNMCPKTTGGASQNSCPMRTMKDLTLGSVKEKVESCLQAMYDEGKLMDPNNPFIGASASGNIGHYMAMISEFRSYLSCGFAFYKTNQGAYRMWMNQDFTSGPLYPCSGGTCDPGAKCGDCTKAGCVFKILSSKTGICGEECFGTDCATDPGQCNTKGFWSGSGDSTPCNRRPSSTCALLPECQLQNGKCSYKDPTIDAPTKKPTTRTPTKHPTQKPVVAPTKRPTQGPCPGEDRYTSCAKYKAEGKCVTLQSIRKFCPKTCCDVTESGSGTSKFPTKQPTTKQPTKFPTKRPTTKQPTKFPTKRPTKLPTGSPTTKKPSATPGSSSCTGKDTDTRCAKWARKKKCGAASVKFRCPQSCCGSAGSGFADKGGACSGPDTHKKCTNWKANDKCSFASVKEVCPQSCCSASAKFEGFPPEDQEDINNGIGWLDNDVDDEVVSSATTGEEFALRVSLCTASIVGALLFVAM